MYPAILSSLLALAPPGTPPPAFDASDIEVTGSDGVLYMMAYDADGEVSADVATWMEDGVQHVDVRFADGIYWFATIDGDKVEVESNDPAEAAARAVVLETSLASWKHIERDHVLGCTGSVLVTVGVCGSAATGWGLLACTGTALLAGRNCAGLLEDLAK